MKLSINFTVYFKDIGMHVIIPRDRILCQLNHSSFNQSPMMFIANPVDMCNICQYVTWMSSRALSR